MLIRPRGFGEAYWVCAGALFLLAARLISARQFGQAVYKGLDVYLFLTGMMILAELAREEGVFEWVAALAGRHANGSASRLFLLVYVVGIVVTAALSNDATAVVLTPAVLAVARKAKVSPEPYVLACALIANAASFVLPISNPANIVIFDSRLPTLFQWLRTFLLPSIASILVTFLVLRIASRKELTAKIKELDGSEPLTAGGKLALLGLVLACTALIIASALGKDLGAPTCIAACIALALVLPRDRAVLGNVVKGVSWSILPLVAGLFVIVEALQQIGLLQLQLNALNSIRTYPKLMGNLLAAFGVGLASNVMNNLPVGLLSGASLQTAREAGRLAHATLIGVDLGPNLSVTGSLATILWLIALRREGVEITSFQFLKIGIVAMPLAMLASVLLLTS